MQSRGLRGLKELTETCCAESKSEFSHCGCRCPCWKKKNPCCSMKARHVMYPQNNVGKCTSVSPPLLLCSGRLPASQLSWLGWNHQGCTDKHLFLTSPAFTDFKERDLIDRMTACQHKATLKQTDVGVVFAIFVFWFDDFFAT